MPLGISLKAVSDALKFVSATAKVAPGAGSTVGAAFDLASSICDIVQTVKTNKKAVEQLAVRAGVSLIEITNVIQRADESKRPEYEDLVKELYSVYQEMKDTAKKLTEQSRFLQLVNRSQIKETLTDLDGKLSKTSIRFGVHTLLINTMTLDALTTLCTDIHQWQKDKEQADVARHAEAKQQRADLADVNAVHHQKTLAAVEKVHDTTKLASLNPVATATWNSDEVDKKTPYCVPETRVDILKDISLWASSAVDNSSPSVLWLCGPAGTGKSTIARTACRDFVSSSMRCASFFFSRQSPDRRDPSRVACSLAFQLAETSDDTLQATICSAIEANITIASRLIPEQIKKILEDPLSRCAPMSHPLVFVLDALDECDKRDHVDGGPLLPSLDACIRSLNVSYTVRLFVTSREEPTQAMLNKFKPGFRITLVKLHEKTELTVNDDIARYLQISLREIHSRLPKIVPSDWPEQAQLDALAARAGVLFVYAATLVRYIDSDQQDPKLLLTSLLAGTVDGSGGAYKVVDELYYDILVRAVGDEKDPQHMAHCLHLRYVVGSLILLQKPLFAAPLALLIGATTEDVDLLLPKLSAVLIVDESNPVTVFHTSFSDFITDPGRCTDKRFYIDSSSCHTTLAQRCLILMNEHLIRDMCNVNDPSLFNSEVADPSLPERLCRDIPEELAYACQYWAAHVPFARINDYTLHRQLLTFCKTKLLYWVEVLSLTGVLHLSYGILDLAKNYCNQGLKQGGLTDAEHDDLTDAAVLFSDTSHMIREFYPAIRDAALHIYYSAIPMMPQCRLLEVYSLESQSAVHLRSERRGSWHKELLHTFYTAAIPPDLLVFLPGNRQILCAITDPSFNGGCRWTIEIWDVATGKSVRNSEDLQLGNDNQRVAVSLSPDGTRLVSTRSGSHARIWSTATAQVILELRVTNAAPPTLEWNISSCNAFSSDGRHVAVCLDAQSIQLWDAHTGDLKLTLPGDDSLFIDQLFISHDCNSLICVSKDNLCLRIWDLKKASVTANIWLQVYRFLRPLVFLTTQHIGALVDETDLEGDDDNWTVKYMMWGMDGVLHREIPLNGYYPNTLLFSQDGKMVLTMDVIYRLSLVDLETGAVLGTLERPENIHVLTSINISDDSSTVVAGGYRGTLCVWDIQTRRVTALLTGYGPMVGHVSISPDCSRLVSFCTDGTVRLWEVSHSRRVHTVPDHMKELVLVSIFDDGERIVSLSMDSVVTVLNTQTGEPSIMDQVQLQGHPIKISCVAVSADGTHIIGGSEYQSWVSSTNELFAFVWDSATGKCVRRLVMIGGHTIISVSLSKEGSVAALVDWGGSFIVIWSVRDDRVISRIFVPTGSGNREAVMSPDGSHVATYLDYNLQREPSIQVYDVVSCYLVASMSPPIPAHTVYTRLKYLSDGTLYAFGILSMTWSNGLRQSALHAWHKHNDNHYGAMTKQLPVIYVIDPREGSHWIWRVVNGDIATSHRVAWVPPDRHCPLEAVPSSDNNSPGDIMAFLSEAGYLTILDFADVARLMSSLE